MFPVWFEGYQRLMVGLIHDAFAILEGPERGAVADAERARAMEWIMTESDDPLSFEHICAVLDLPEKRGRRRAEAIIQAKAEGRAAAAAARRAAREQAAAARAAAWEARYNGYPEPAATPERPRLVGKFTVVLKRQDSIAR